MLIYTSDTVLDINRATLTPSYFHILSPVLSIPSDKVKPYTEDGLVVNPRRNLWVHVEQSQTK